MGLTAFAVPAAPTGLAGNGAPCSYRPSWVPGARQATLLFILPL